MSIFVQDVERENRLVLTHVYTATAALVVGALFGLLQVYARANALTLPSWFDYYRMLTVHGVLMALVFTTFFITGLSLFLTYRSIPRERNMSWAWWSYGVMLAGTLMAALTILSGNATVLYTFYAPLKAHPAFYFGATLLILGTWMVAWEIIDNVVFFKQHNPREHIPLPVYGAAMTFIMWFIATLGVVAEMGLLIPWSLGWTSGINVMLTRMLFWYFGHPLVYFWIMGAYLFWYTIIPTRYGGFVLSDGLTRLVFLMLLLLSTPVGIHHQFMEPGIANTWKWLHTVMTYGVAVPSFMTAFAVFASFELAARAKGKRGFIATVANLPWRDPVFTGSGLGMLLFIIGGFGGIVNASNGMDAVIHNTIWIVGHFHVTVGGPVALTFIGATYWLVPAVTGRKLFAPQVALYQTYLWFFGMLLMSIAMHWAGLLGSPRRTSDVSYMGSLVAANWHPEMVASAIGGSMLFVSILMFVYVAVGTRLQNKNEDGLPFMPIQCAKPDPNSGRTPHVLDRLERWAALAIVLAVGAYVGPVSELLAQHAYLAPGMRTW